MRQGRRGRTWRQVEVKRRRRPEARRERMHPRAERVHWQQGQCVACCPWVERDGARRGDERVVTGRDERRRRRASVKRAAPGPRLKHASLARLRLASCAQLHTHFNLPVPPGDPRREGARDTESLPTRLHNPSARLPRDKGVLQGTTAAEGRPFCPCSSDARLTRTAPATGNDLLRGKRRGRTAMRTAEWQEGEEEGARGGPRERGASTW